MRSTKILLVCFGLVLLAGLRVNCSSGAASAGDRLPHAAILTDGGDPPPIPPLMDGGDPPPIPPLVADGGDPPPIPPLANGLTA
jgi:hypothetical protein